MNPSAEMKRRTEQLTPARRVDMLLSVVVGNRVATLRVSADRILADIGFAVSAGDIQNIGRLAQSRDAAAQ